MAVSRRSYGYRGVNGIIRTTIDPEGKTVRVARNARVTFRVDTNLARLNEVGTRTSVEIAGGNIDIDGTLDKAIWDGKMLKAVIGSQAQTLEANFPSSGIIDTQNELNPMQLEYEVSCEVRIKQGESDLAFKVTLKGVKLGTWTIVMPQQDWITESISFMAKHIKIESLGDVSQPPRD